MRVAPVGLLYWWNPKLLLEAATDSSRPTHVHPLGIEGARIMALAAGLTIQGIAKEDLPAILLENVKEEAFRKKLLIMTDLPCFKWKSKRSRISYKIL